MKMAFKAIVGELRDGIGNISRRGSERRHWQGRSHIAPERCPVLVEDQSRWASMPPELLLDIISRVEGTSITWPARRDVVACASVCRSWRELAMEVVKTLQQCGLFTFPISVKQPGPRDSPIQCFIKRERASSTYRLYLGLSPALSGNVSKLLLAARKVRRATGTEFIISFSGDDFSKASDNFVGKLRSNFLGTKFSISDNQPPYDPAVLSDGMLRKNICSKQRCPRLPVGNCNMTTVMYELNVLRTRGPRRMQCILNSTPNSSTQGGTALKPIDFRKCAVPVSEGKTSPELSSLCEGTSDPLVLKNKSPRWHEQLQCWCLNFKGRVTVASVKNFQLVAASVSAGEQEQVILQFGKIGKDIFTMDYGHPLSAFQAFAICLSSFDTKPACE